MGGQAPDACPTKPASAKPFWSLGPDHLPHLQYQAAQYLRVAIEFFPCCRLVLCVACCRLCDLLHLENGACDLLHATRLLLAAQTDFVDQAFHASGVVAHCPNRACHLIEPRVTIARGFDRFFDQARSVAGGLGTSLCQVPDFVSDYRKA